MPVSSSALSTDVSPAELWRQNLQAELSKGWNTWMRDNAARHLHLPSGFGVEVAIWSAPPGDAPVDMSLEVPSSGAPPVPPLPPSKWRTLPHTDFPHNAPWGNQCNVVGQNVTDCAVHCAAMPNCAAVSWNWDTDNCCNFKCSTTGKYQDNHQVTSVPN